MHQIYNFYTDTMNNFIFEIVYRYTHQRSGKSQTAVLIRKVMNY